MSYIGKVGTFLIDDMKLHSHFLCFALIIVVFATLYTALTPYGHGIGSGQSPLKDASFSTGLYFSVVTISSLGYSYMHPMGISKVLAASQVLIGLMVVGIMIARVTSARLSHYVSRVFSSNAQVELKKYVQFFEVTYLSFYEVMPDLSKAYPSVPGIDSNIIDDRRVPTTKFRDCVSDLRSHCFALHDYLSIEVKQGQYFDVVPRTAILPLGEAIERSFWILGQLITSLSARARTEVFNGRSRREVFEALERQQAVCKLVVDSAADEEVRSLFVHIKNTCEQLPTSYFAIPEEQQPDQATRGSNEPQ